MKKLGWMAFGWAANILLHARIYIDGARSSVLLALARLQTAKKLPTTLERSKMLDSLVTRVHHKLVN